MKKIITTFLIISSVVILYFVGYNQVFRYSCQPSNMHVLDTKVKTKNWFISENNYAWAMKNVVLKRTDSIEKKGVLVNNEHNIAYNYYLQDGAKANIVVSHGYTERKEKYKELIYYFLQMGYQVFVLDHYSHGNSSRHTPDSSMVYVENYNVFTSDLNQFIQTIVTPNGKGLKTILFGHSMGGGIAARTIEQRPDLVDALVLSAPLMKLTSTPPDAIKHIITHLMLAFGNDDKYTLGHRAYNASIDSLYEPSNPATLCKARGAYWYNEFQLLTKYPSNGASWKTIETFLSLTHDVVKKENVQSINVPILLFQAEKDTYVAPEGHYEFANHAKNIQFYLVKGSAHEIYFESDSIIAPFYTKINTFIDEVIGLK